MNNLKMKQHNIDSKYNENMKYPESQKEPFRNSAYYE